MSEPARSRLEVLVALGILLFATLAMTWPLAASLSTHLPGFTDHPGLQGDLFFQWNLERQMAEGSVDHLDSPYTLYPEGERFRAKVAFSLHLALYVALMTIFDLFTAHNLAVLLILFSNAVAAWILFRDRTSSPIFALACALLFAFGPWVQLKLDQGFVQKITLFHLPLFVFFLLRLLEQRRRRDAAWCAVFLVIGALVYPPFAVFDVLLATVLIAACVIRQDAPRQLTGLLIGLSTVLAVVVCVVWFIGRNDFLTVDHLAVSLDRFRGQGGYLDVFHPFRWFPYLGTFGDRPVSAIVEHLPLGIPLIPLVLAIFATWKRQSPAGWLLAFTCGAMVLMAGPFLMKSGELILIGGRPVPLPSQLLENLPFSQAFRYPIRIYPWLLVALLLAASEAVNRLRNGATVSLRRPRLAKAVPCIAAALILFEPWLIFPEYRGLHVEEPRVPSICATTSVESAEAVLHLPFYPPSPHDYLMAAVLCDQPMVNAWQRNPPPMAIPLPDALPEEPSSRPLKKPK